MKAAFEMVVIHGLGEVADHPIFQGAVPSNLIRVRSEKNGRDPMSRMNQVSVQLNAGHPRHLDVGDQASGCGEER